METLLKVYPSLPVLIVDDDEGDLLALATTLQTIGITNVRTVSDSTSVPAMLCLEAFSLVLLDLNMPGQSGFEILKTATKLRVRPPFIIITGRILPPEFVIRLSYDVVDYLMKPVERERLIGAVRTVLEKDRQGLRE